jgi:serine O-acetyltransferase
MGHTDLYSRLVYARKWPLVGRLAYYSLKLLGVEIPRSVEIGADFYLVHGGFGVVIHPHTIIGDRVKVYPGVTIGRADIHLSASQSDFEGIVVKDDAILSPGAKILCKAGVLRVGKGTIVGANAVLLQSTGERETWAGIPAKLVGSRSDVKYDSPA